MMIKIKQQTIVKLVFLVVISQNLFSAFERLGIGARAKGMGEAFCAVSDDISSIYWNPAGILSVNTVSLAVSYEDLFNLGLVDYYNITYLTPNVGDGNIALSLTRLAPKLDFLNYSENVFIFSYARCLFKHDLSFGCNVKYFSASYNEQHRGSAFGIDVGLKYRLKKYGLNLGLLLQDVFATDIRWSTGAKDKVNANVRAGIKYKFISVDLNDLLKSPMLHIGCESKVYKLLYLRTGAYSLPGDLWCYTVGFSIKIKRIIFDFGCELHPELGYSNVFSLGMNF